MTQSYKDLIVWQKAIDLADAMYSITEIFPQKEVYGLSAQMRRAAISIPSNIAEGQRRKTLPDFLYFLRIAYGSAAELETQIIISKRRYSELDYSKTDQLLEEIQKMLNVLIKKLENKNQLPTTNYKLQTNGGYIAMTSAIIISMLVIAIVFAINLTGYFNRSNVLTSELKDVSLALAEGCAEKALLKYSENTLYAGNENITIGDKQCNILPIETSGNNKILKTKAAVQSSTSNIKVTFDGVDMTIIFWEEVASF